MGTRSEGGAGNRSASGQSILKDNLPPLQVDTVGYDISDQCVSTTGG